jgi:hypothetical protein
MSSISLNTGSSNLYPLLNNSSNENPLLAALAGGSTSPIGTNTTLADGAPAGLLDGRQGPNSELFQKVQQAVTSALTSIQGNSSANPNQVIQQAILQVIAQTSTSSNAATGATSPSDPEDSETDPTQSFFSSLKDYGIDPQQFQSDFLSALTQAQQTGQASAATAFNSFPTGLSLDATA